ncbi:DMT family transporter [Acidiferrimicrobium sp. IK]|uniref:DMT family transporter n=1 Tax=Acidiferrimicrobium sp. IK TaxID=2871700 RepID=UPI0021CB7069|nr:DMT family transporter [Acidiferrimicrobium sp. IK]MCU4184523.1 DMT family transporter [Acidiferrimicrobium sp. IK]
MTIVLAVLSAALFGCGVGLQQRPARNVPDVYAAKPALLSRVVRRPLWLLGIAAEFAGFGLQVVALRHGALVVVQPLITTSLLFTLALAGLWSRDAVTGREWAGVVAVIVGLSAFMVLASPSEHSSGVANQTDWFILGTTMAAGVLALLISGFRSGGRSRAALFGLAAGLGDAVMAVLTKALAHSLGGGVGHTIHSWSPYALCVAGIGSILLSQTAYQTGRPTVSLPLITVTDPIVSSAIGVALFGEALRLDGLRAPAVILAALVMVLGLVALTRSTAVIERDEHHPAVADPVGGPV